MNDVKPLVEINKEAIRILTREIGIVNTLRFIGQFTVGYGDYTQERDALFTDVSLEDIISDIKRDRADLPKHL